MDWRNRQRPDLVKLIGPAIGAGQYIQDVAEPGRRRLRAFLVLDLFAANIGQECVATAVILRNIVQKNPDHRRVEGELRRTGSVIDRAGHELSLVG